MEDVFVAAARLQELVPDAVLVGGSSAVHHAGHRVSLDDDHVVRDLRDRFDDVLADLEATEGWITARVQRLGDREAVGVILGMDRYYADQLGPGGRRIATQVARQLAEPRPDDLSEVDRWRDWRTVADACRRIAGGVLDRLAEDSP